MIISDENSSPIIIDSISTPISTSRCWVLDLEQRDFMLAKIEVLEEHITPVLEFEILGYHIELPANWNILVYSRDTSQLDIAEVSEITRGHFTSFILNHHKNINVPGYITAKNYKQRVAVHTPSLNKYQMLCHHLGPDMWVCVSPIDNYNKYLKGAAIGDILP